MADGAGDGEGDTHDEPVSKDEQSDEDIGPRSGFEDEGMDEEKGEEEDMDEEVELELFADQHEDTTRKAPERLRQPVLNATDVTARHPFYRFWDKKSREYLTPEELDTMGGVRWAICQGCGILLRAADQ